VIIKEFEGKSPEIDPKSYIAEGAVLTGDVKTKEYSSIWYNVVMRGDVNRIEIGRYTNIQDNTVVHVDDHEPCIIGDYVTVGHQSTIHACTIEDHCLIGMGAIVLSGAYIGKGSIIAAGAVVKENQIIPPQSLVMGIPAKIIRSIPEKHDEIHAQALKYKTLWTKRYGILPDAGGEEYNGEKIV
jgi:carbonic anhydrase/acetyltransferase-like protein (isoleucine patch superfamily)